MSRLGDFTLVRRRLRRFAEERAVPLSVVDQRHAAEGLLRRLALSPEGHRFALRGSLLERLLPQATDPPAAPGRVELVFDGPSDDLWPALQRAASEPVPDAVRFDPEVITLDPAPRPGGRPAFEARLAVHFADADTVDVSVDLGPHLPTCSAPYPAVLGPTAPLRRQTAAAAFAERLQALVDPARLHFAPGDLLAAWRLARGALDPQAVAEAIDAAFAQRGVSAGRLQRLREDRFGESKSSLKAWRRFSREWGTELPEVGAAVAAVRALLQAAEIEADESRLGAAPAGG